MSAFTLSLLVFPLLGALEGGDSGPWHEHYERGVALIQQGQGAEGRRELERSLELRPEAGLRVRTYGVHYVDYLPHLYLAVACHMSGDTASARRHLEAAERTGVAEQSEMGRELLSGYRFLLEDVPPGSWPTSRDERAPEPPRYKAFERKPTVLSENEFEQLREDVLNRCRLPADTEAAKQPWFYHYELGLSLARRGDSQRALDSFIEAVERRPDPQHAARIYGMWFLKYVPYWNIARSHARLGNRECALDALALSRRLGEVPERDEEMTELRALLRTTEP